MNNDIKSEWILAKVKRFFVCNPDKYLSGNGVLRIISMYETESVLDEMTPDEVEYLQEVNE